MTRQVTRMLVLAAWLVVACYNVAPAQPLETGEEADAVNQSAGPDEPIEFDDPVGPTVIDTLPGGFSGALISPLNYISPFAALFSSSAPPSSSGELTAYYQSTSRSRLLDLPEMFGDFRRGGPMLLMSPTTGALPGLQTEIPLAAGISGLRVAENNHALPADRVWFAYNYFDQAFDVQTDGSFGLTPQSSSQSLHRTVIAMEKLLDDGRTSIELRMPFGAAINADGVAGFSADPTPFSVESDSIGNLNLLLKRLLYADDRRALSVGLGLEVPTGSTSEITYGNISASLEPEAVHFVPFVAFTQRRGRWFGHAFSQLDVASHGDPFRATLNLAGNPDFIGRVNQSPLLGVDLGGGYWLIPPCDCGRGLAIVGEVHYTTPLGDADTFAAAGSLTSVAINTPLDEAHEVLHFTSGLQLGLGDGWQLRSAVVLPADDERVFDAEYLLQLNRRF